MDSLALANYGSDDEYEDTTSEKMGTSGPAGNRTLSPEADVNYDEVQMDLSEESNNNNSAEDDDQPKLERPSDKKRTYRSRSRDDPRSSKSSESRSRHRRDRSEDRNRKEDDKERSRKYDSRSKYDKESSNDDRYDRKSSRDDRNGKSRDEKRRRRSSSRDRKRSASKDRKRSLSRDRKRSNSRDRNNRRSGSKDRRRSGSKERRRSRSPRRDERRRRSSSKERDNRGNSSRYGKRFDRTSSKIAQLEKLGIEIKTPDAEFVTPQMLLQRSMDEQVQKVKNSTGIELPKYYNPAAMNPARYADQIQKRRLLWQKKDVPATEVKPPTMGKVWEQTTFAQDNDGKVASKFKRLMGIKDNAGSTSKDGKDILKKQEEMFSSMEQQYEVARTATHTMRGVGLGFGTFNNYPR